DLRRSMDAVQRLPGSAGVDIAALGEIVGERDPDIVRWRQKITRVDALHLRLARLDQAPFAGAALRAEAEADLNALIELVGDRDQPHITRWQLRIADSTREILRLADLIAAEMDRAPIVSLAQRERLALPMAQMRALAGTDDPRVLAWNARLEAADQRLAELRVELGPLVDPAVTVTEASATRLSTLLAEYDRLADMETPEAKPWRERLQAFGATMDALRRSLARIDEAEVVSEEAQAAVAADLATYRALASPGDARLAGWLRRLVASRSLIEDLRGTLVVLDERDAFSLVEIEALWVDHERLRPLVLPTDAQASRWGETLGALRRDVAAQRALLERLLADQAQAPVSAGDRGLCERALSVLSARQALNEQDRQRFRRRLILEQERVDDLRRHLLAREDEPVRDRELADAIRLFGRLAGEDDADFARWFGKGADYLRLRDVVAPLDDAVAIPAGASAAVDALAALVGEEDAEVVAWRRKIARVGQLQSLLAPLSARAPTPDDASMLLAELHQLVGDFAEHPAWDAKLTRIARLHADLQRLLGQSCVPSAEAPRLVSALAVEVGDADARVVAWRDRMRVLAGPGQPAWAAEHGSDASGSWARLAIPGSDLAVVLRYCPPGSFVMGSPSDEIGRENDERQVLVTLTSGMWMAETECTQALWTAIMRDDKRTWFSAGPDHPADGVARDQALAFCARVSALIPGVVARLPTEAEWEYACRAGSRAPFSDGEGPIATDQVDRVAWSRANARAGAKPVRGCQANRLGLHDLHGNLWEWCADGYAPYDRTPVTDPAVASAKGVARGGSWGDSPEKCRAANRLALDADTRSGYLGFRFVISPP
nr:formylglycine-generating enzyme family protein [Planctomycetota bacterium]